MAKLKNYSNLEIITSFSEAKHHPESAPVVLPLLVRSAWQIETVTHDPPLSVPQVHGSVGEPWWLWVEDPVNDHIYHSEYFLLQKKQVGDLNGVGVGVLGGFNLHVCVSVYFYSTLTCPKIRGACSRSLK